MTPHDHGLDEHDRGLAHDLPRLVSRRAALGTLMAGGAGALLAACGSGGGEQGSAAATTATTSATRTTAGATGPIAEETAGPFPGYGQSGPNVLAESGVVRRDITASIGGASGVAEGAPATIEMTLIDVAAGGGPLAGAAVYLWHCTADGRYSLYDDGVTEENFLRGVQESDAEGRLAFDTVFPGAYTGRWPHAHFEVYESLDAATSASGKLRTSQLAIPKRACDRIYATAGYERSVENLRGLSLEGDLVFSDGYASQLATVTDGPGGRITLALNVGV